MLPVGPDIAALGSSAGFKSPPQAIAQIFAATSDRVIRATLARFSPQPFLECHLSAPEVCDVISKPLELCQRFDFRQGHINVL